MRTDYKEYDYDKFYANDDYSSYDNKTKFYEGDVYLYDSNFNVKKSTVNKFQLDYIEIKQPARTVNTTKRREGYYMLSCEKLLPVLKNSLAKNGKLYHLIDIKTKEVLHEYNTAQKISYNGKKLYGILLDKIHKQKYVLVRAEYDPSKPTFGDIIVTDSL